MADIAVVTIAGQPVEGGRYGEHRWRTCLGLAAPSVEWRLPVALAAKVLANRETDITITPPGGATKTYHVVVVGEGPCDDPYARTVILSDTRWYLTFINLIYAYNRRVPSGTGHLIVADGIPFSADALTADVTYSFSTLKNDGTPIPPAWYATEIVDDLFTQAQKRLKFVGMPGLLIWNNKASKTRGKWVPNDVMGDASATVALAQVLGQLGGLDIRCEPDGSLAIVDAYMGAEKSMVTSNVTYSLDAKGVLKWISMAPVAPRFLTAQYTRECEVRADAFADYSQTTQTDLTNSDAPWAENVISVADFNLPTVTEHGRTFIAIQGMYIGVSPWFVAVAGQKDAPAGAAIPWTISTALTFPTAFSPILGDSFVDDPANPLGPDSIWANRLGKLSQDLFTAYRLNPRFASRCIPGSITAKRVGLLNAATGQRAPSQAWRDYIRFPSRRGLKNQQRYGYNMISIPPLTPNQSPGTTRPYSDTSFPDHPFLLTGALAAPFVVSCEDQTIGIFRISPRPDPLGKEARLAPGLMQTTPSLNPFSVAQGQGPPILEDCHLMFSDRVAFIFSAVPVGSYGGSQTHDYKVDAATALIRLGVGVDAVSAQGPGRDLRIGDSVARARFAWDDSHRADILTCFNRNAGGTPGNLTPVNDNALNDLAIASAATVMAAMLDHFEGTATIGFTPSLLPVGSLHSVDHFVTEDGRLYTTAHAAFVAPTFKPEQFMSQASRFTLFGSFGIAA